MGLKQDELIRHYLHVDDITKKKDDYSILLKVEPVVYNLRTNCLSVEQEQHQSVDKQMVPAKTKRSGICQYFPKKIHKWVFKNFIWAAASGIIYNFFFYAGQSVLGERNVVCLK